VLQIINVSELLSSLSNFHCKAAHSEKSTIPRSELLKFSASKHIHSHLMLNNCIPAKTHDSIYTTFKRCLFWQDFPQKNAEAVHIIFDCPRWAGISKHLRCHICNSSTPPARRCLCCSLLLPFCQSKITYLKCKYYVCIYFE